MSKEIIDEIENSSSISEDTSSYSNTSQIKEQDDQDTEQQHLSRTDFLTGEQRPVMNLEIESNEKRNARKDISPISNDKAKISILDSNYSQHP